MGNWAKCPPPIRLPCLFVANGVRIDIMKLVIFFIAVMVFRFYCKTPIILQNKNSTQCEEMATIFGSSVLENTVFTNNALLRATENHFCTHVIRQIIRILAVISALVSETHAVVNRHVFINRIVKYFKNSRKRIVCKINFPQKQKHLTIRY